MTMQDPRAPKPHIRLHYLTTGEWGATIKAGRDGPRVAGAWNPKLIAVRFWLLWNWDFIVRAVGHN